MILSAILSIKKRFLRKPLLVIQITERKGEKLIVRLANIDDTLSLLNNNIITLNRPEWETIKDVREKG